MDKEIYSDKHHGPVVLDKGHVGKFYWTIISLGSHPCCYVGVPKGHKYYNKGYDGLQVDCHGGLTFASRDLWYNPIDIDLWWLGWDFAHCNDYYQKPAEIEALGLGMPGLHKWTLEELRAEVKSVIKQLQRPRKIMKD